MISKAIDPGRSGLSKSLMTSWCERQGFYSETVRQPNGWRYYGPKNEKMLFGSAVDEAHAAIVSADMLGRLDAEAVEKAVQAGLDRTLEDYLLTPDPEPIIFEQQLRNAMSLFLVQEGGIEAIRQKYPLRIQGDNGRTLVADDVIGTPDYMGAGVIDVKTSMARYYAAKFRQSAEMPVYSFLYTAENGALPEYLAYQVYVRKAKPEWQWLEVPGQGFHVALGQQHADRWRKGLAAGDPSLFSFDVGKCPECPFRQPIPEVGFEGCAVGRIVPIDGEEDAA